MRTHRRYGKSLADLIVLIFVVMLCSTALLHAAVVQNEKANRIECATHLKQIGNGLILYSNENKGLFPRTYNDRKDPKIRFFTKPGDGKDQVDPFDKEPPEANDQTAAMFLLIRQEDLSGQAFLCPSVSGEIAVFNRKGPTPPLKFPGEPELEPLKRANFPSPKYLNYSMTNVYPPAESIAKGYKTFITAFNSDFAVAGDLNPGNKDFKKLTLNATDEQKRAGNSKNHGGDGQNVLYADGHVEFQTTPFCGVEQDNIYTYGKIDNTTGGDGIVGPPVDASDSVLIPSETEMAAARDAK